jgi:ABC-type sugar transport system substrate-binding protein
MKVWTIATAAVSAVLLVGVVAGAERAPVRAAGSERASARAVGSERAPVRIGVILNYLDDPFFVALYEGVTAETRRLGVRATIDR